MNEMILGAAAILMSAVTVNSLAATFLRAPKVSKNRELLSYLTYLVCVSISHFCVRLPAVTVGVAFIAILRISLIYREKLRYDLLYAALFTAVIAIPAHLLGYALGSLASYLGAAVLAGILAPDRRDVTLMSRAAVMAVPALTMAAEILLFRAISPDEPILTGFSVMMLAVNAMVYFLNRSLSVNYVRSTHVALLEKENELYCRQCEIMQTSTEDLQAFRHDLNNQFIAMSRLMDEGKYGDVGGMLEALSDRIQVRRLYSFTGCTPIDSIVNYKLQNMAELGIDADVQIAVPDDIKVETADIITILGNLLDNALTALMKCDRDDRKLILKLTYTKGRLVIRAANSYVGEIKYSGDEIVTSKAEEGHGFGLKNIAAAAAKYDGCMEISHGEMFTVDILMYI